MEETMGNKGGLLSQRPAQGQQVPPAQGQQVPQEQQVPPELQEQFDMFVANGISIIHEPKTSDAIIEQVKKNPDPIDAIAKATLDIVTRLEESAAGNGITLDNSVKIQGANHLMGEIINIIEVSGVKKLAEEQKYQAFSLAISMYLDNAVKTGKITKDELIRMGEEAKQTSQGQGIMQHLQQQQPQGQQQQPQGQQQQRQQQQPQRQQLQQQPFQQGQRGQPTIRPMGGGR